MTDKTPTPPNSAMVLTFRLRWNGPVLEQLWEDWNGFAGGEWRAVPTVTPEDAP